MNDLDKLMKKLRKDPVEETAQKDIPTPKEEEIVVKAPAQKDMPVLAKKEEVIEDEDDDDEDPEENPEKNPTEEIIPNKDNESVNDEVALLQNDGIYRRELLLTKKEEVGVFKVIAETLLNIRDFLVGEKNGKKTSN